MDLYRIDNMDSMDSTHFTMVARASVTPTDKGPILSLLTWIMSAAMLLAVVIKITLSTTIFGRRCLEDLFLFFALVSEHSSVDNVKRVAG